MHLIIASLLLGAAAGKGSRKIAWRPLVKSGFKQGILLSRKVNAATVSVRQQAQKLVEEARVELDQAKNPVEGA